MRLDESYFTGASTEDEIESVETQSSGLSIQSADLVLMFKYRNFLYTNTSPDNVTDEIVSRIVSTASSYKSVKDVNCNPKYQEEDSQNIFFGLWMKIAKPNIYEILKIYKFISQELMRNNIQIFSAGWLYVWRDYPKRYYITLGTSEMHYYIMSGNSEQYSFDVSDLKRFEELCSRFFEALDFDSLDVIYKQMVRYFGKNIPLYNYIKLYCPASQSEIFPVDDSDVLSALSTLKLNEKWLTKGTIGTAYCVYDEINRYDRKPKKGMESRSVLLTELLQKKAFRWLYCRCGTDICMIGDYGLVMDAVTTYSVAVVFHIGRSKFMQNQMKIVSDFTGLSLDSDEFMAIENFAKTKFAELI